MIAFEQKDYFAPVKDAAALKTKFRALSKKFHPDKKNADPAIFAEIKTQHDAYAAHFADGAALPDFTLPEAERADALRRAAAAAVVRARSVDRLRTLVKKVAVSPTHKAVLPHAPVTGTVQPSLRMRVLSAKLTPPADLFDYDYDGIESPLAEPPAYNEGGDPETEQTLLSKAYPEAVLLLSALITRLDLMKLPFSLDGLTLWLTPGKKAAHRIALDALHLRFSPTRKQWYYPAVEYAKQQTVRWTPSESEQAMVDNALDMLKALPAPQAEAAPEPEAPPAEVAAAPDTAPEAAPKPAKKKAAPRKPAKKKAAQPTA